jgi:hypothetical protein
LRVALKRVLKQNGGFYISWPPRTSDLIQENFFLLAYMKVEVYPSPLPQMFVEMRVRIVTAVTTVNADMFAFHV